MILQTIARHLQELGYKIENDPDLDNVQRDHFTVLKPKTHHVSIFIDVELKGTILHINNFPYHGHQLDITDPTSITKLEKILKVHYNRNRPQILRE